LREERCVYQRLPIAREVYEVGRRRVDGLGNRAPGELRVARAQLSFACRIRRQLDPGREPCDKASDRFEVRHRPAIRAGRLFDRHARLQRAVREVGEDGIGEPLHERDPRLTIARSSGDRLP